MKTNKTTIKKLTTMKKIIVLLAASFIACVFTANAQSYVNGYYRQNGIYVRVLSQQSQ